MPFQANVDGDGLAEDLVVDKGDFIRLETYTPQQACMHIQQ